MTTPSDTPVTDAKEDAMLRWKVRSMKADMRGSHLDSDDPQPKDGWEVARDLERVANALAEALKACMGDSLDHQDKEGCDHWHEADAALRDFANLSAPLGSPQSSDQ